MIERHGTPHRLSSAGGTGPTRLRFPKTEDKSPFQTWAEIERQLELGGRSETEQAELWEGLYLSAHEIEQVLDFAEQSARHPAMDTLHGRN